MPLTPGGHPLLLMLLLFLQHKLSCELFIKFFLGLDKRTRCQNMERRGKHEDVPERESAQHVLAEAVHCDTRDRSCQGGYQSQDLGSLQPILTRIA